MKEERINVCELCSEVINIKPYCLNCQKIIDNFKWTTTCNCAEDSCMSLCLECGDVRKILIKWKTTLTPI